MKLIPVAGRRGGRVVLLLLFLSGALWAQEQGELSPGPSSHASDASTGPEPYGYLGRFVSRGELTAAPTAYGERMVAPSADRRLYLLEPGGEVVWRAELGGKALSPVTPAAEGTLAVVTDREELSLFDGEDGRLIWRRRLSHRRGAPRRALGLESPGPDTSGREISAQGNARPRDTAERGSLLTNREGMIILALDSRLTAFSLSGSRLWSRRLRAPFSTSPIWGEEGPVLVATTDGRLSAFSPGGALRWTTIIPGAATDLALWEENFVVLEEGRHLRRFDAAGKEIGLTPLPLELVGAGGKAKRVVAAPEGRLVIVYRTGGVLLLDRLGEPLWSAPGALDVAVTAEGVLLSFPGGRGELRGYGGRLLWELQSEGEIRDLLRLRGQLVIIFGDWVVSWYRSGESLSGGGGGEGGSVSGEAAGESLPRFRPSSEDDGDLPVLFRELFRSPRRSDRERLVRAIEDRVSGGELAGIYRGIRNLTVGIAREPYTNPRRAGATVQNDFPELRARAVSLLGGWGDLPSWRGVLGVLREEREPEVVLTALDALSRIPYDWEGEGARTMLELARRWSGRRRFPAIAEGILDAMAAVRTAPEEGAQELYTAIATADLPAAIRDRARRLMASHFENRR